MEIQVLSIFEDRLGILWFGTNFNGISKYNPSKRFFIQYKHRINDVNSVADNTIYALYQDSQGIIWIGTSNGLDSYDRKINQFTHYTSNPKDPNSLSDNVIRSICEDRYKMLWIGTVNGVNRFDPIHKKFTRYLPNLNDPNSLSHQSVFNIYKDRAGNIWIGTLSGLNRYDYEKNNFSRYVNDPNNPKSLSDNFIWSIYEDTSGTFWIGTLVGGVNQFDPTKGTFIHYQYDPKNPTSISGNKVLSLFEDHTGCLWMGTTNGLNKFDRNTGTFCRYNQKDGLPNSSIQAILEDDHGNLWIGTNSGLSKFNPATNKFKNYFESYGLQSNEFEPNSCWKFKNGEMMFGGIKGFNIFHPDSIKNDLNLPTVVMTDFQILNKPVPIGKLLDGRTILEKTISECAKINLSYVDNVFSFGFAALHYASPNENLYAYMMEGFEKEWNYTDANRRFATYTNLPPGQYIFHVKASNNQGAWNESGTFLKILITPPFWETWWFRVVVVFFIFGLLFLGLQIRTARIRTRNRELEQHVSDRTGQLQLANKELEAFAYSISHDLRAPLRAIDGYTNILLEGYEPMLDKEGKRVCTVIRNETKRMSKLIDDLLSFSYLGRAEMQVSSINMEELVHSVYNELTTLVSRENIDFHVAHLPPAIGDPTLIHQVWVNLISNAIKFSSKQTRSVIGVEHKQDGEKIVYSIRDNGVGFNMQYSDKLFGVFQRLHSDKEFEGTGVGLAIVKRLIDRHGGIIWAESQVDKGAAFFFTLPRKENML